MLRWRRVGCDDVTSGGVLIVGGGGVDAGVQPGGGIEGGL